MKLKDAYPSAFLQASDFDDGDMNYTIKDADIETLGQGKDAEQKLVLKFKEVQQKLACNKTNANMIASLLKSDDTDDWIGKKITLGSEMVPFGQKMVNSIRVRGKLPGKPSPAPSRPEPDDIPMRHPGDGEESPHRASDNDGLPEGF